MLCTAAICLHVLALIPGQKAEHDLMLPMASMTACDRAVDSFVAQNRAGTMPTLNFRGRTYLMLDAECTRR